MSLYADGCDCRYSSVTGRLSKCCPLHGGGPYRYHGELTLKQLLAQRPDLMVSDYFEQLWLENARKTQ